jgi:hypothetical protein
MVVVHGHINEEAYPQELVLLAQELKVLRRGSAGVTLLVPMKNKKGLGQAISVPSGAQRTTRFDDLNNPRPRGQAHPEGEKGEGEVGVNNSKIRKKNS